MPVMVVEAAFCAQTSISTGIERPGAFAGRTLKTNEHVSGVAGQEFPSHHYRKATIAQSAISLAQKSYFGSAEDLCGFTKLASTRKPEEVQVASLNESLGGRCLHWRAFRLV